MVDLARPEFRDAPADVGDQRLRHRLGGVAEGEHPALRVELDGNDIVLDCVGIDEEESKIGVARRVDREILGRFDLDINRPQQFPVPLERGLGGADVVGRGQQPEEKEAADTQEHGGQRNDSREQTPAASAPRGGSRDRGASPPEPGAEKPQAAQGSVPFRRAAPQFGQKFIITSPYLFIVLLF